MARLTWDPQKARTNLRDHKVSFELAMRIFEDPMVSQPGRGALAVDRKAEFGQLHRPLRRTYRSGSAAGRGGGRADRLGPAGHVT